MRRLQYTAEALHENPVDNATPKPITASLAGHEITHAGQTGWEALKNGDLIRQAALAGFDLLLSTDKNIKYQQNLARRTIAIIVLGNQQWPVVQRYLDTIGAAAEAVKLGGYSEVEIPL